MAAEELGRRDPAKLNVGKFQHFGSLSPDDYEGLKSYIAANGLRDPVQIDEFDNVLDGHSRVKACCELGLSEIDVVINRGLTDDQKDVLYVKANLASRNMKLSDRKAKAMLLSSNGWRQSKIAEAFGVTQQAVSRWLAKPADEGNSTKSKRQPRRDPAVIKELADKQVKIKAQQAEISKMSWQISEYQDMLKHLRGKLKEVAGQIAQAKKDGTPPEVLEKVDDLEKAVKLKDERISEVKGMFTELNLKQDRLVGEHQSAMEALREQKDDEIKQIKLLATEYMNKNNAELNKLKASVKAIEELEKDISDRRQELNSINLQIEDGMLGRITRKLGDCARDLTELAQSLGDYLDEHPASKLVEKFWSGVLSDFETAEQGIRKAGTIILEQLKREPI